MHPLPISQIREQILCILEDFKIDIIKIGMMCNFNIMSEIYDILTKHAAKIPVILDPIFNSTTNSELLKLNNKSLDYLKNKFIPYSYIITPNIPEAEKICDMKINDLDDMVIAAGKLQEMGANTVLLKGGHDNDPHIIHDVLLSKKFLKIYESARIDSNNTRGSGCSLASAIAANLANKKSVEESIHNAREYVYQAIKNSIKPANGAGTLNHHIAIAA